MYRCGYVDSFIQECVSPPCHTIIEAHPDVLSLMRGDKLAVKYEWLSQVRVKEGKWQQVIPQLIEEQSILEEDSGAPIDSIFYDTHDEGVSSFLTVAKCAAQLLRTGATTQRTFSFWNGSACSLSYTSLSLSYLYLPCLSSGVSQRFSAWCLLQGSSSV